MYHTKQCVTQMNGWIKSLPITPHPDRLNMQFPSHLSRASVYLSFASSESVMRVGEILDYEIPWLWGIGIVMDFNNIRSVVADILFCVAWTVWHNWVNHGNGIRGRTGSTDWAYSYSLSDYKPFCLTQQTIRASIWLFDSCFDNWCVCTSLWGCKTKKQLERQSHF